MSRVPVVTEGRSAAELLEWGHRMIEAPLRDAVLGLPETARMVTGYHFGWWDRRGRPVNGRRGKAVRPTLLLLCAKAMGSRPSDVAHVAAAVELVHNFSLVHDDVMDGDRTRHDRPAVWHVFGVDQAVLAGDAMLALATRLVAESAGQRAAPVLEWLGSSVVRLCEGQFADLRSEEQEEVTLPECLAMVEGKTSALLECSCAVGALLAGADDTRIDRLRAFGRALGIAFQIVDDTLGIWGDPAVTGKPVGADLARRKKTLPVVVALASKTAAAHALAALYGRNDPLDAGQAAHAARLIEEAGGRAWAMEEADTRLSEASAHLDEAGCEPASRAELLALARLITRRDR